MTAGAALWDAAASDPCERLAWMAGQTNFLDASTGQARGWFALELDVAALSFSRMDENDIGPELVEAYWSGCDVHRWTICHSIYEALCGDLDIKDRDKSWVRGAILDAFDLFRQSKCQPYKTRAKQFGVDNNAYLATRKLAEGVMYAFESGARVRWRIARYG